MNRHNDLAQQPDEPYRDHGVPVEEQLAAVSAQLETATGQLRQIIDTMRTALADKRG